MTSVSGSLTVGIDIGTTSTKAVAVDAEGAVVARSRVPHKMLTPAPDLLEHDAGRAWRSGPLKALAELSSSFSHSELAGVCVAGMVPSLTPVGPRGSPIGPGLLYGDRRGRPDADADPASSVGPSVAAAATEAAVEAAGAAVPGGRGTGEREPEPEASKGAESSMPDAEGFMRWAVREFPGARGYWPAQAVANYVLGGVPAVDSAVSMSLGALMTGGHWDTEVLEQMGVSETQLPLVVPMCESAGVVKGTNAALAGGTVDALCDQIVSGAEQLGDVLVICGATLVVWAVISDWVEVPGLWTVPHTVGGRVLIGGPSNAGALFVDWARGLIANGVRQTASKAPVTPRRGSREGDPGRVPVWTPYIRGERAPFHDPMLRSGLYGLDITHDSGSLERAAFEASGFVIRQMLDRAKVEGRRIVASGGGTRVLGWMQAMADATGLPVDVVAVHEGAALGAAYLARMAAGQAEALEGASSWARTGERIEPDPRWSRAATERYERFVSYSPNC